MTKNMASGLCVLCILYLGMTGSW